MPGISIRNGPIDEDVEMKNTDDKQTNGVGLQKRKARDVSGRPSYAESEATDDDDIPLV